MCNCVNVQFGTFGQPNQNRTVVMTCLNKMQEIDNCILEELQGLWEEGVITYASCCGHNTVNGSIIIDDEISAEKMKELNYLQYWEPELQGFWFYPKSIPITNKYENRI